MTEVLRRGGNRRPGRLVVAALVGLVLLGGIRSIASVTSRLVPAMAAIYIVACLVVILTNVTHVPDAFQTILQAT
jgi:AGCS family alanine or glycine:cation symporter